MKSIVLIQPKVGYLESLQDVPLFPLALMSVSSYLAGEYEIRIIDQRLDRNWETTLKQALSGEVVCVGVTSMTGPQISFGLRASKIVRETTDLPIIWGGIHASILPAETVANPLIDIVVAGEGEVAFRDLVRAIDKGESYHGLPGIWTMQNGEPVGSPPATIPDLGTLPPLPYHLVSMEPYIGRNYEGQRKLAIKTSRGCPWRCYFCHQTGITRQKWRSLPADRILTDMHVLIDRYDIRCFHLLDDNFFVKLSRAKEFLQGIVDRGWDISYVINGTRITDIIRMDEEMLALLARTGCSELQIGLESGSQRMLDHMKKDQKIEQILEADLRLKAHGIPRYYELISGHRDETEEDLHKTAELILQLSENDPNVFFAPIENMAAYPGTEVFEQARDAGMVFPTDLEGWSDYEWDRTRLPWMDKKRRLLLERFHIFPTLVSARIKTEKRGGLLQTLYRFYRPIARFRVRHLYFGLSLELLFVRLIAHLRDRAR
jgi:radical SAM superfamily enzyme YgiQ (UPF0313 family)